MMIIYKLFTSYFTFVYRDHLIILDKPLEAIDIKEFLNLPSAMSISYNNVFEALMTLSINYNTGPDGISAILFFFLSQISLYIYVLTLKLFISKWYFS